MFNSFSSHKLKLPTREAALPGRAKEVIVDPVHYVTGNTVKAPFPQYCQSAVFGLGCFWGAEKRFWSIDGVYSTAVGYAAGITPNPNYEETCTGLTGHNEVVLVVFDARKVTYEQLLTVFWESHDPTQGMKQGNDVGTQYRSGIYFYSEQQKEQAVQSAEHYQKLLTQSGLGAITTEIIPVTEFYYAETYHQQYLAKNTQGYCGLGGTGVCYAD
jgi:peptide-methionine (S)-S-oxide reductase